MPSVPKEIQRRNEFFKNFCNLACPDFSKIEYTSFISVPKQLEREGCDLEELYYGIERFVQKNSKGIIVDFEIPVRPKGGHLAMDYKEKLSKIIEKTICIEIPASSIISISFYEAIVKHCIKTSQ